MLKKSSDFPHENEIPNRFSIFEFCCMSFSVSESFIVQLLADQFWVRQTSKLHRFPFKGALCYDGLQILNNETDLRETVKFNSDEQNFRSRFLEHQWEFGDKIQNKKCHIDENTESARILANSSCQ